MSDEQAVNETVYFTVTVRTEDRGDCWFARTIETGIIDYGATSDEAEANAGDGNERIVRWYKAQGRAALDRFMREHGLAYTVGEPDRSGAAASATVERQLAA